MLADAIISGILFGGIYALIASGFSIALSFTRILNLAHGEIMIFAAYFCYFLFKSLGIDPFISLLIILPIFFLVGFVFYNGLSRYSRRANLESVLLLFIAISTILQNLGLLFWLSTQRSITLSYLVNPIIILGINISPIYLVGGLVGFAIIFGLHFFLTKTKSGLAIRAIPQDAELAATTGINYFLMGRIAFGLAFLCAGLAGAMVAVMFTFNPTSGLNSLLIALSVVVLGGLGSIFGCLVGGLILGVVGSLASYYFGAGVQLLIGYIIFLIVLLIKPKGLFGRYVL